MAVAHSKLTRVLNSGSQRSPTKPCIADRPDTFLALSSQYRDSEGSYH